MKKSSSKPMPPKPSKTKMRMGAPVAKAAKGGMMGGMGKPAGMMGGMGKPADMKHVLPVRPMPVRGGGGVPVQGPGGRPMKPMRPMPKKPAGM